MGIHDRHYMRPDHDGPGRRLRRAFARMGAAQWAVTGLVVAGVIQFILTAAGQRDFVRDNLALSLDGLRAGKVWEVLSYGLIHGDFWHLFFNALGLWFLGRGVNEEHGSKKFWKIFGCGVFVGALAWAALWSLPVAKGAEFIHELRSHESLVGASAGVFALMAYYMADKLREEFRMLLFLIIPVTLEGGWILGVTAAMSLVGLLLTEIPLATGYWPVVIKDFSLCHSAHFAGLALGFVWRRVEMRRFTWFAAKSRSRFTVVEKSAPKSPSRPAETERRAFPAASKAAPPADLRAEVDRILDKINAQGFGALTPEERTILEKARETLNR